MPALTIKDIKQSTSNTIRGMKPYQYQTAIARMWSELERAQCLIEEAQSGEPFTGRAKGLNPCRMMHG